MVNPIQVPKSGHAPLSLIILTYNEEINLEPTLEAVSSWVGEIIIVDSFSTDKTSEIAAKYSLKVYQHPFENQAQQFNWALDSLNPKYEWMMRLDADEIITPPLAKEICETIPTLPPDVTGIYLKRKVYFMHKWMKHGGYYPKWFLRIFRKGKGRYEALTEEHFVLSEGKTIQLKNDFIDYNRKGLTFWIDKHNHWSIGEMLDTLGASGQGELPNLLIKPSLWGSQEQRIRWLKNKFYVRFPLFARAFLYFIYRYLFLFGFLDGVEGLIFHFLQGFWYRFLVDAKIYEAKRFGLEKALLKREYTGTKPWK